MQFINFGQIHAKSMMFFRQLGLDHWAEEIDRTFEIQEEDAWIADRMQTLSLNQAIVLPSLQFQYENMDRVIQQFKDKGLNHEDVLIADRVSDFYCHSESGFRQRSESSAYLLFYNLEAPHKETFGLSAPQVKKFFEIKNWTGLTTTEFMLTLARDGDQLREKRDKLWTWLVDSDSERNRAIAYYTHDAVRIYHCKYGSSHKDRGALVTQVVPLREVKQFERF